MKKRSSFTLVELLAVIAIIAILAGLITPAVIIAQQKGRVTQAKADMKTLATAIKGLEGTYSKLIKVNGSNAVFAGVTVGIKSPGDAEYIRIGGTEDDVNAYDNFIVELCDPSNPKVFNKDQKPNINIRRKVFLDAQTGYDPSKGTDVNANYLWRDPWGNRYVLLINTNFTNRIPDPADNTKYLAGSVAIYSFGPNGTDDNGKNTEYGDDKVQDDGDDKVQDYDDIVSWKE